VIRSVERSGPWRDGSRA